MNMGEVETEGGADDSADRHRVTYNGYGTIQRSFLERVNDWPRAVLQLSQWLAPRRSGTRRVLKPTSKELFVVSQ
jgi:hypothetical protein